MVSMKRSIAALIVCFKPHVFLTLCILLVIAHSIVITVQRGAGTTWRFGKQHDLTVTMTTLVLVVALIWAAFFIFIVRFELRNELDSLLILFQCSKRGLRFLGVVGFHVGLLMLVALIVSATVERSMPADADGQSSDRYRNSSTRGRDPLKQRSISLRVNNMRHSDTMPAIYKDNDELTLDEAPWMQPGGSVSADRLKVPPVPIVGDERDETGKNRLDRVYLLTVYKIWLTAIVYAFSYLVIENVIMFYFDMSLIEFVHDSFLSLVTRVTGVDLSDYPAGEMLFNPLVRHRIR